MGQAGQIHGDGRKPDFGWRARRRVYRWRRTLRAPEIYITAVTVIPLNLITKTIFREGVAGAFNIPLRQR